MRGSTKRKGYFVDFPLFVYFHFTFSLYVRYIFYKLREVWKNKEKRHQMFLIAIDFCAAEKEHGAKTTKKMEERKQKKFKKKNICKKWIQT